MGTRHLIAVIQDNEIRVAQYGQWDGYPEGQGEDIVAFIMQELDKEKFTKAVSKLRWVNEREVDDFLKSIGSNDGMLTDKQNNLFLKKYPALNRDHGSDILSLVQEGKITELRNSWDFGADSLFCEFAYVLDMDKDVLEIYEGFNKNPLPPGERFANLPPRATNTGENYFPVKLVKAIPFSNLTTASMATLSKEIYAEDEE